MAVYHGHRRYKDAIAAARRYDASDAAWRSAEYGYRPYSCWLDAAKALGDTDEVRAAAEAGCRAFPEMPEPEAELGVSLWNEGKEAEALPHFKRAVALSETFADDEMRRLHEIDTRGRAKKSVIIVPFQRKKLYKEGKSWYSIDTI